MKLKNCCERRAAEGRGRAESGSVFGMETDCPCPAPMEFRNGLSWRDLDCGRALHGHGGLCGGRKGPQKEKQVSNIAMTLMPSSA